MNCRNSVIMSNSTENCSHLFRSSGSQVFHPIINTRLPVVMVRYGRYGMIMIRLAEGLIQFSENQQLQDIELGLELDNTFNIAQYLVQFQAAFILIFALHSS